MEKQSELPGRGKRKFVEEAEKSRTDARPSTKGEYKNVLEIIQKLINIKHDAKIEKLINASLPLSCT